MKDTLEKLSQYKRSFYTVKSKTTSGIFKLLTEVHDEPYYFEVMASCYDDFQYFNGHELPEDEDPLGENVSKLSEHKQKAYETFKSLSPEKYDTIRHIISDFVDMFYDYFSDDSSVGFLIQNNTYMICEGVGEREIYYGNS